MLNETTIRRALGAGLALAALCRGGFAQDLIYEFTGSDWFGLVLAEAGDVDADGVVDLVFGSPKRPNNGLHRVGFAEIRSGADAGLLWSTAGDVQDLEFGTGVAGLGDVNGDGFDDVAVSGKGRGPSSLPGQVRVVSGRSTVLGGLQYLYTIPAGDPGAEFGTSIAVIDDIDGDGRNDFAVGAPLEDVQGKTDAGAVHLFSGVDGSPLATYAPAALTSGDRFGFRVTAVDDIDGDQIRDLVVSAPDDAENGTGTGKLYVLSSASGTVLQQIWGSSADAGFGTAIAGGGDLDGDGQPDIAVGMPTEDIGGENEAGRVRLFSATTGVPLSTPAGLLEGELGGWKFGFSVDIGGDLDGDGYTDLLVGAPGRRIVRVYSIRDGLELGEIEPGLIDFGSAVRIVPAGISGARRDLLIGAWGHGRIRLYGGEPYESAVYCTASPNSVGQGAHIGWSGSLSFSANDLVLSVDGCPPGQNGLFYFGTNDVELPFGDGFRCVGGGTKRLGVQQIAQDGTAQRAFDNTLPAGSAGPIAPGVSRNFQFWYRDPSFGSFGFNLSDALHVTFQP